MAGDRPAFARRGRYPACGGAIGSGHAREQIVEICSSARSTIQRYCERDAFAQIYSAAAADMPEEDVES